MKKFKILLSRQYVVEIMAEDSDKARRYTEYFLGDCPDLSSQIDNEKFGFNILDVELVENEASVLFD